MTYAYILDRLAGPDPNLRAADADRERVAERLRRGHAEGRLDLTEFQQRLEHCYAAKTLGELRELVRDLPRQVEETPPNSRGWRGPRRWSLGRLAPVLIALILVPAALGHHLFWLWIPLVFLLWRMSWSRRRQRWALKRHRPDDWI